MSWNIGSFVFLRYLKYFGITAHQYEYFQPKLNGVFVSNTIQNIDPDFLYLQEFWFPKDSNDIQFLQTYPYKVFFDTWYRQKSILIASKKPFSHDILDGFPIIKCNGFTLIPIHLNSFSPTKRSEQIDKLCEILSTVKSPVILLGDTNIGSRQNKFLFSKDKQGYLKLTTLLKDASKDIISTSFFGFGLNKIFTSKNVRIEATLSPKIRGKFMDHYPIYVDAQLDEINA